MGIMQCQIHRRQGFYEVCEHIWENFQKETIPNISRYPKLAIFPVIIYKVADRKLVEDAIDPYG